MFKKSGFSLALFIVVLFGTQLIAQVDLSPSMIDDLGFDAAPDENIGVVNTNLIILTTDLYDQSPIFTSATTATFTENGTGTVYTAVATDDNTITYSLGTGNDEGLFDIVSTTGIVTFKSSPDFEAPTDTNTDNAYVIQVNANDGVNTVSQNVTVSVTNQNEPPVFTSTPIIATNDNASYEYSISTSDPDGDNLIVSGIEIPSWLKIGFEETGNVSTLAEISGQISGLAIDGSNNIYAVSSGSHQVYKVSSNGIVSVLAGSSLGYVDGSGNMAQFNTPTAIATDASNNIYVADAYNYRIRKITPEGVVSTLAGSGIDQVVNDIGTSASFGYMSAIAVDSEGNVFVNQNSLIRKITPAGVVTTYAGTGAQGNVDGPVSTATIYQIGGMAFDKQDNLFVITAHRIRKISKDGVVSTIAGSDTFGSQDGLGTDATFHYPSDLMIDVNDNIYVADRQNNLVRKISSDGLVTTIAGSGVFGDTDGPGTSAEFKFPMGIDLNSNGTIYVGDEVSRKVRKVELSTNSKLIQQSLPPNGAYNIRLQVNDNNGSTAEQNFTITVNDVSNPVFTSSTTANFVENGTGTAYTAVATDANTITYSLGTSKDEALFDIVGTSGVVTFKVSPDFETPTDGNTDNTYNIQVNANDGVNTVMQTVNIVISDADEIGPKVTDVRVSNGDGIYGFPAAMTVSVVFDEVVLVSGVPQLDLETGLTDNIINYVAGSGSKTIEFSYVVAGGDFTTDLDYVSTSSLSAGTSIKDQSGNDASLALPIPGAVGSIGAEQNISIDGTPTVSVFFANGNSAIEGSNTIPSLAIDVSHVSKNPIVVSLQLSGTATLNEDYFLPTQFINGTYTIEPNSAGALGVSFNKDNLREGNETIQAKITAVTNGKFVDAEPVTLTIIDDDPPIFASGTTASFAENATDAAYIAEVTTIDMNNVTYSLGTGNDEGLFNIDASSGIVTFKNAPNFESPADANADNVYMIEVKANDGVNTATQNATISVTNQNEAPFFTSTPITAIDNNQTYSYQVKTSDPDQDEIAVSATQIPDWLTLTKKTVVNTYAGTGVQGYQDGPSDQARFNILGNLDIDSKGNVIVADWFNNVIRKITPNGIVSTIAGNLSSGFIDGTGSSAQFRSPISVAVDTNDNIYVADASSHAIRKITKEGVVTTLAGNGTPGFVNGNGSSASFNNPVGLDLDIDGNVYVADQQNHAIRKITPEGNVTTFAGSVQGYTDGISTNAQFSSPVDIAIAIDGSVYVTDGGNNRVRKISTGGIVSTFAGSTGLFFGLRAITIDTNGNLFVSDARQRIRKIDTEGNISTFTGSSVPEHLGAAGDVDGDPADAKFSNPYGLAIDKQNNVFVSEEGNRKIRKIESINLLFGSAGSNIGSHQVSLKAVDSNGGTVPQSFTINVSDITNPVFTSPITASFTQNGTGTAYTVVATDAGTITYNLGTSNDEALFNIMGTTGVVTFKAAPDFQAPTDANADNEYIIEVKASDGSNNVSQLVTISVTDGDQAPILTGNGRDFTYTEAHQSESTLLFENISVSTVEADQLITSFSIELKNTAAFPNSGTFETFDGTTIQLSNTYQTTGNNGLTMRRQVVSGENIMTFTKDSGITADAFNTILNNMRYNYSGRNPDTENVRSFILKTIVDNGSNFASNNNSGTFSITANVTLIGTDTEPFLNTTPLNPPHYVGNTPVKMFSETNASPVESSQKINQIEITVDNLMDGAKELISIDGEQLALTNGTSAVTSTNSVIVSITVSGQIATVKLSSSLGLSPNIVNNLIDELGYSNTNQSPTVGTRNFKLIKITDNGNNTGNDKNSSPLSITSNINLINEVVPPAFTSSTIASFAENGTGIAYAATASSVNSLTYSFGSSKDEGLFDLVSTTGAISFKSPPNFEAPSDMDANNVYNLDINATDGTNTTKQSVLLFVENVNDESPIFNSQPNTSVDDINQYNYTIMASDADGDLLTISANSLPSWLTLETKTNLVSTLAGSGNSASIDGIGTAASFLSIRHLSSDKTGNIYVADAGTNLVRKITQSGEVTTIAGFDNSGVRVNANGTSASFSATAKAIYDNFSNSIYVLDASMIRKIDKNGDVTDFAGSPFSGFVDGVGTEARFRGLIGGDVDNFGNLYVADFDNHVVRKITPEGVVTTLAGSGIASYVDATGVNASFNRPFDIAVDSQGNIYVADEGNDRIRKITPNGTVSTLAGSGTEAFADGTGINASFFNPRGIDFDSRDNLYVADGSNNRVRKITPSGVVTTIAGSGALQFKDGEGTEAHIRGSYGLTVDKDNNIYVTSVFGRVRKITNEYKLVGNPKENIGTHNISLTASDGVSTTIQSFVLTVVDVNDAPTITSTPVTSVADNATYRYEIKAADPENDAVSISATTLPSWLTLEQQTIGAVTTFAGSGANGAADGTGLAAEFQLPLGTTIDKSDNLFIADYYGRTIRKVSPTGMVTTIAGSLSNFTSIDGTGTAAGFAGPSGMGSDKDDNLYVSDGSGTIRKITPSGVVTTIAGSGSRGYADGQGITAEFNGPTDLTIDSKGNIFIADTQNHRIRKITPDGIVSTFAGSGERKFIDGTGTNAAFNIPYGITVDSSDNLYIADNNNHSIRKITPQGVVTTIAGDGIEGYKDGQGTQARFDNPAHLVSDANGILYVADFGNKRIRRISTDGSVSTIAGSGTDQKKDGLGMEASFNGLLGIVLDSKGSLFISESSSRTIRKLEISTPVPVLTGNPLGQTGSHNIVIKAEDTNSGSVTQSFDVSITNTPPVFVYESSNPFFPRFEENSSGSVFTAKAIDVGSVTYFLGSNFDEAFFDIDQLSGVVSFKNSPDFETPLDADKNNSYYAQVFARDEQSSSANTLIRVFVTNADDQDPVFISSPITAVDDNANYEYIIKAQDADGERLEITGGNIPDWLTLTNAPDGVTTTILGSGQKALLDGNGVSASFNSPSDIAVNSEGDYFIVDSQNHSVRKVTQDGNVSTFAGNGQQGSSDGIGTSASFNSPKGIAIDQNDNIFISDTGNNRIRKITKDGQVSTFAGSTGGFQDGQGVSAMFNSPRGLAVHSNGVIYVADGINSRIRTITPSGLVSTFVGHGDFQFNDGVGTAASISFPQDVTFDTEGNLFIADWGNFSVRKVTPAGMVTTISGKPDGVGTNQPAEDGIVAAASFGGPQGIVVDKEGNIYITESHRYNVRKISPSGIVTTIAGNDMIGFSDGNGPSTLFGRLDGLLIDKDGNLLVADSGNDRIRKVTIGGTKLTGSAVGQAVTHTVDLKVNDASGPAGTQSFTITVNDVTKPVYTSPVTANFAENGTGTAHTALATDANTVTYSLGTGNDEGLFDIVGTSGVITFKAAPDFESPADANTDNAYVIQIEASDGINSILQTVIITVLNEVENATPTITSSPITTITDTDNYRYEIKTTDLDNDAVTVSANDLPDWLSIEQQQLGVVTSFVGSGTPSSTDGTGSGASFGIPLGMTSDQSNNIYVAEFTNHTIRKISPSGVVTTLAGTTGVSGNVDGQGAAAHFNSPFALALDNEGNILVADQGNNSIRKISSTGNVSTVVTFKNGESNIHGLAVDSKGNIFASESSGQKIVKVSPSGQISTFAGSGTIGFANGIGANASFNFPFGMTIDNADNLYVIDKFNYSIRKITSEGVVTTLAGTGFEGYVDGEGSKATFSNPNMITSGASGNLYISDTGNHRIRKITKDGYVSTVAGSGEIGQINGTGIEASLSDPFGITLDATGNIFFSEPNFHKLRKIELTAPSPVLVGYPFGKSGSHIINLTAEDGNGGSVLQTYTLKITDTSPEFIFGASSELFPNFAENSTATVYTAKAIDGGEITYSLGSAKDESLFEINASTGILTFQSPPDFENPLDQDKNNSYLADIIATDNNANFSTLQLKIFVNNVGDQVPVFISNPTNSVDENTSYSYEIKAEDPDGEKLEILTEDLPEWLTLVTIKEGVTTTLVGSGEQNNQDGSIETASFRGPRDMVYDSEGNLFVADGPNLVIRKITPDGTVSTFAGSGSLGSADGMGTAASFSGLWSIVVDNEDNLLIADVFNHKIRKVSKSGDVTTLAGSISGYQDGSGSVARFDHPSGLAIKSDGTILVADSYNHRIRSISQDGTVSTFAGNGERSFLNGKSSNATFATPFDLTVDKEDNVYLTDLGNNSIRKITPEGLVSTVTGSNHDSTPSSVGPSENGHTSLASFNGPYGITIDKIGNLYVTENETSNIRKISTNRIVSTIAGNSKRSFADGIGSAASFHAPHGIIIANDGNLLVADVGNNRIRKVTLGSAKLTGSTVGQSGSHTVRLKTRDASGSETTQTFTITINDTSNPVFTSAKAVNFAENGTGTAYTVTATDASALAYSLGTSNDEALFDISGDKISFKASPNFEAPTDQNTDNAYVIEVKANDGTNTSTQLVTITVTDADEIAPQVVVTSTANALVFTPSFKVTFTFSELVTGFDASDLTVTNGTVSDFKGSGNTYSALISATADGNVSVQIAKDIAQDAAGNNNLVSNTITRTIEATNIAPSTVNLSANKVSENAALATEVGTLSATDADENDRHTFALVDGTGGTNNSLFRIIGNKLIATATFDYETIKVASIRVRATDTRGLSLDAVKQIEILNIAEPKIATFLPSIANPLVGDANLLFEAARIGQTVTRTVEVTNSGTDGDLSITDITLPAGFTVDKTTATISQGQKEVLTITFSPTEEKIYAGVIVITSNAGEHKVRLGGRGKQNRAPIAVSPNVEVFVKLSDLLKLRGYDPDGDAIEFVITRQPQQGTITATTDGLYSFTPNGLSPGQTYQDALKFKVVETGGGLESAEAELKFKFRVNDQAHAINSLAVSSKTDEKIVFDLKFLDPVVNDAYQLKVSYYNLSDPTNPVFVPLLSQSITKSAITTTDGVHGFPFESASSGHDYLFNASRVFMVVELTTANGYLASDGYILRNESSGSSITTIEGAGSTDGEFFVFASQTTVPENESVEVNLFAVDLGSFSLTDATIAITKSALKGTSTAPVEVKKTTNLAQWKLTYTSETEVGLLDSLQFTVTNPSRSANADAYAKVEVIEVADAPVLSAIADQQTNEEEAITVDLVVTDPDSELTITATSSESTNVPVTMVGNKLIITPGKDFNGTANISVLVTESNSSTPLSTFDEFQLTVVPVNDKPVVTAISDLTVVEDSQLVVTLAATDVDGSLPIFTYSASADNQANVSYTIEGDVLTITPTANYNGTITFGVTADDGAGTTNSVSASEAFTITVSPENDAPTSISTINTQTLLEVIPAYTLDLAQYFTDIETAAKDLTYTVSTISNAGLSISGATLAISSIAGASGVETAIITASDGELSVAQNVTFLAASASTEVTVANPVTDQVLAEDFGVSSIDLSNVFALSGNAGASFSYILTGNNIIGASMNGTSLELTSVDNFNGTDELIIIGTADGKSSFTKFKITVNPANDAPNLATAINDISTAEDALLTQAISSAAFSDIDGDALTYSASYTAAWLSFDAATRTFSGTPANGDVGTVAVIVTATDPSGATATDSFNLVVSNTNDDPTAITFTSKVLNENIALNSVVSTLTSVDPDAGDDSFTYSLVTGTGSDDNASFDIIGNQLVTASSFDFESKTSYSIRIKTTDGFEGSYTEVVTIAISNVNEAATAIGLPVTTIAENQSTGTIVSALTTTDPDASDSHTYSLVLGTGDTDNASFAITDGKLTSATAFDFEAKSSYAVRIKTTDAGGLSIESTFTISISNANEVATDLNLSEATIAENAAISTEVADLITTDPDVGDTHSYSLVAGEGDTDNANFKIEGTKLLAASSFNFENKNSYSLRLKSTDASGLSFEKSFTITVTDVNDAPNGISADNLSIEENKVSGTTIGSLTTLDQDGGDTHSYSLVSGEGDADNASFTLEGNVLKTAASYDFETKDSYAVRIKTTDAGGLSFEIAFQVAITNQAEAQMRLENNATLDPIGIGSTATFNITVFNDGDGAMNVTSITYPEGFSGANGLSEIAPSASAELTVTFSPSEAKTYSGDIVLTYNGGEQVASVSATGEVITSIDDGLVDEALIKIYPNPAANEFTLDLTSFNGQPIEILLVDGSGVGVYVAKDIRTSMHTVRVSNYSQGVYIVMLRSSKQSIQKKLVIRR